MSKSNIDVKVVSSIAKLLAETDLSEIEVEQGDLRIRVARNASQHIEMVPMAAAAPAMASSAQTVMPAPVPEAPIQDTPAASSQLTSHPGMLKSPMVGTAYIASEPGATPYASVGSKVEKGQTVLIIEAMKTMNQIPAQKSGTVIEILFEDAQPVEYGEPLLIIE